MKTSNNKHKPLVEHFRSVLSAVPLAVVLAVGVSDNLNAELVLVADGKALTPIVIFEDAPPLTRQAADTLADYMERISGVRPDVLEGQPYPVPETAIWVGYQPAVEALFPEIDFDFKHPEEMTIAATASHLIIVGRDIWDPEHLTVQGHHNPIDGYQSEYGTANAVYTFLQDHLDVRWLWPGALGTDIVEQETLAFEPFEHRYRPHIRSRSGMFVRTQRGDDRSEPEMQEWSRHQRLMLDSFCTLRSHGFIDWFDRFHEDHPEYFALQPDGTRSGFPRPHTAKLCKSNPDVWEQWLQTNVKDVLKRNPLQNHFHGQPNDGHSSGICICERCREWDHPDGESHRYMWQGHSQEYVAMSDRHIHFANALGRRLKEAYPDRDYYVRMSPYGPSRPKPVEARPDDNVVVVAPANFTMRDVNMRQSHLEDFRNWTAISKNYIWRPNIGYLTHIGLSLELERTPEFFKLLAEAGVMGIYFDGVREHWLTQGPQYYLWARLAWEPLADAESIMNDYYKRAFGPAAPHMEAYWRTLDQAYSDLMDRYPAHSSTVLNQIDEILEVIYTKAFEEADRHIELARQAVADGPETFRERVFLMAGGLDYLRNLLTLFDLSHAAQQGDQAALEEFRSVFEETHELMEQRDIPTSYALASFRRPFGDIRRRLGLR